MVTRRKGEHQTIFDEAKRSGFVRVRVNGDILDLSDEIKLNKQKWHTIEDQIDELRSRLTDSLETALKLGNGLIKVLDSETGEESLFSEHFACVECGYSIDEIEPRTFSFNNPQGACSDCTGLGYKLEIEPDLVIPDTNLSLEEGAILPWKRSGTMAPWYSSILRAASTAFDICLLYTSDAADE